MQERAAKEGQLKCVWAKNLPTVFFSGKYVIPPGV